MDGNWAFSRPLHIETKLSIQQHFPITALSSQTWKSWVGSAVRNTRGSSIFDAARTKSNSKNSAEYREIQSKTQAVKEKEKLPDSFHHSLVEIQKSNFSYGVKLLLFRLGMHENVIQILHIFHSEKLNDTKMKNKDKCDVCFYRLH